MDLQVVKWIAGLPPVSNHIGRPDNAPVKKHALYKHQVKIPAVKTDPYFLSGM